MIWGVIELGGDCGDEAGADEEVIMGGFLFLDGSTLC